VLAMTIPVTAFSQKNLTGAVRSQQSLGNLDSFYSLCRQSRPDNIHRLCINYMRKNAIRKDSVRFARFGTYLMDRAKKDGEHALYRRLSLIALVQRMANKPPPAEELDKAFESLYNKYCDKEDYPAALECLFELSQLHHHEKRKIQAIKVLFFAEKMAHKHGLQKDICYEAILHKIGYILWELDKPRSSNDYFERALSTGNGTLMDSLVTLNGLGINYQKLDSLERSMLYFNLASEVALAAGNHIFHKVVLGSAAVTLFKMGNYDKAYDYAFREKELSNAEALWENAAGDFYLMIQIELKRNNLSHAKSLLDSFNTLVIKHIRADDFASRKREKEAAYMYYEKLQDHKNALLSYKQLAHYDSLFQDQGNKNKISELELNAEVRLYEEEMADKERTRKMRTMLESIIIVVALLLIAAVIWFLYKKIKRTEKDKFETEKINVQQAAEIETLKLQLIEQLTTIRNENIHFQAMVASREGNTELPENNEITEAPPSPDTIDDEVPVVKSTDDVELLKAFNLSQKVQWKDFKISFHKVYPDFETSIVNRIGVVSGAELRLMMLHKLGLSNKEIAQTLLISPDSVKKAKYRLYKKIGINSSEELNAFLGIRDTGFGIRDSG
jgi:DNA-binding CsgD family transcriptional regulator/tetratricopeptide (TPR) repeat protein